MVCATTGAAASIIGGKTFHSALGTKVFSDKDNVKDILERVGGQPAVVASIRSMRMLIIDEISMATSFYIVVLKAILEHFRDSRTAFGGVLKIVLVGDLKQLPPVVVKRRYEDNDQFNARVAASWCFKADDWSSLNLKYYFLTEIVRTDDPQLRAMVSRIANGSLDPSDELVLEKRKIKESCLCHPTREWFFVPLTGSEIESIWKFLTT